VIKVAAAVGKAGLEAGFDGSGLPGLGRPFHLFSLDCRRRWSLLLGWCGLLRLPWYHHGASVCRNEKERQQDRKAAAQLLLPAWALSHPLRIFS
jgi:hypothetical protein